MHQVFSAVLSGPWRHYHNNDVDDIVDILGLEVVANHDEVAARHGAEGGDAGAGRAEHMMSAGYRNDAINGGGHSLG